VLLSRCRPENGELPIIRSQPQQFSSPHRDYSQSKIRGTRSLAADRWAEDGPKRRRNRDRFPSRTIQATEQTNVVSTIYPERLAAQGIDKERWGIITVGPLWGQISSQVPTNVHRKCRRDGRTYWPFSAALELASEALRSRAFDGSLKRLKENGPQKLHVLARNTLFPCLISTAHPGRSSVRIY
jgi:hypothetical protein